MFNAIEAINDIIDDINDEVLSESANILPAPSQLRFASPVELHGVVREYEKVIKSGTIQNPSKMKYLQDRCAEIKRMLNESLRRNGLHVAYNSADEYYDEYNSFNAIEAINDIIDDINDEVLSESMSDKTKTALGVGLMAAPAIGGAVYGGIRHHKTNKGYKKDPELKALRDREEELYKEIDKVSDQLSDVVNEFEIEIEKYNTVADVLSAPTISLNTSNESSTVVKQPLEGYEDAVSFVNSANKAKDVLNDKFNIDDYKKLKKEIKELEKTRSKYLSIIARYHSLMRELKKIKKELNKHARKRSATDSDKTAYGSKLDSIDSRFKELKKEDIKEIY